MGLWDCGEIAISEKVRQPSRPFSFVTTTSLFRKTVRKSIDQILLIQIDGQAYRVQRHRRIFQRVQTAEEHGGEEEAVSNRWEQMPTANLQVQKFIMEHS